MLRQLNFSAALPQEGLPFYFRVDKKIIQPFDKLKLESFLCDDGCLGGGGGGGS